VKACEGGQPDQLHTASIAGRPVNVLWELPAFWMDYARSCHLLAHPPTYNIIVAKDGSGKYQTIDVVHGPCTKSRFGFLKNWATTSCGGALREPTQKFPTSPASRRGGECAHKKILGIFSHAG
jgi:hypothetical protein